MTTDSQRSLGLYTQQDPETEIRLGRPRADLIAWAWDVADVFAYSMVGMCIVMWLIAMDGPALIAVTAFSVGWAWRVRR